MMKKKKDRRRDVRLGRLTSVWFWVKFISLLACVGVSAFVIIKWIGPFLIEKVKKQG
ncbi:hypothetical protein Bca101_012461 [Brassica carinata]